MIQDHFEIEHIASWLISGASGCYIVARARQLSRAKASEATWPHFLAGQSDMILALCGSPAIWYIARRRTAARRPARSAVDDHQGMTTSAVHQLRQVFTVLLLGLGMIARRTSDRNISALVQRLQRITRTGASVLSTLDEPLAAKANELDPANWSTGTQLNGQQDRGRYV